MEEEQKGLRIEGKMGKLLPAPKRIVKVFRIKSKRKPGALSSNQQLDMGRRVNGSGKLKERLGKGR